MQKKIKKSLQASAPKQTKMDRPVWTDEPRQKKNNEPLTAPKKNGGRSANTNICATNKV
jgi:hypothetical protein